MLRIFLTAMLTCASAVAQLLPAPKNSPAGSSSQYSASPAQQPSFHPERVGPDTVVVESRAFVPDWAMAPASPLPVLLRSPRTSSSVWSPPLA